MEREAGRHGDESRFDGEVGVSLYGDYAKRFGVPYRTFWGHVQDYGLQEAVRMHEAGEVFNRRARIYKGKTQAQWAREIGISEQALRYRVKARGWHDAVTMEKWER